MSFEEKGFEFGEFFLNSDERVLSKNGIEIPLTPKAIELLLELLKHPGHIVSKDHLMDSVWAGSMVEEANLPFTMGLVRKALGDEAKNPRFIETLSKKGYRFIAGVNFRSSQNGLAAPTTENFAMPATEPVLQTGVRPQRRYLFLGALTLFMLTIAALFWGIASKLVTTSQNRRTVKRITSNGQTKIATLSPDGQFLAFVLDKGDKESLWVKDIAAEGDSLLTSADFNEPISAVTFSPDGERVYFLSYSGLYGIPKVGGKTERIVEGFNNKTNISISPDGRQAAFLRSSLDGAETDLILAATDGSLERVFARSHLPDVFWRVVSWSPDGRTIACANYKVSKGSTIKFFDVDTGNVVKEYGENWDSVSDIVWRPDGQSFLATVLPENSYRDQICEIAYDSGAVKKLTDDLVEYESISLSKDGTELAAVRSEIGANIWILSLTPTQSLKAVTTGFERDDGLNALSWSEDGKLLYSASPNGSGEADSVKVDGSEPRQMAKGWLMAGSPNGRYLLFYDESHGRLGLTRYDLSDGTRYLLTDDDDSNATFSADSKWVAFTRLHDDRSIWRVPITGGEPHRIALDPGAMTPAISMNGQFVAFFRLRRQENGRSVTDIAVVDSNGGHDLKRFDVDAQRMNKIANNRPQWSSDGSSIYFVRLKDGASNIWKQPIDGSEPTQITQFSSGRIYNFAFSPDEKQIVISYGPYNRDAVMIKDL